MREAPFLTLLAGDGSRLAVILGTNEIASAIAVRLTWEGYRVVLSHDPFPPVIRRRMSFHDALYEDQAEVDGITGYRAGSILEIATVVAKKGRVAVTPLQLTDLLAMRKIDALVDARMQKYRVTPDLREIARVAIGVGPSFSGGYNCDVAIETHPLETGALIEEGATRPADGVARTLAGVGKERFIYADEDNLWHTPLDVGARVYKGVILGYHGGAPICSPMDGFLRGIVRDGLFVPERVKLVEIDPRGREASWTGTDERGRSIAEATLMAVEHRIAARRANSAMTP